MKKKISVLLIIAIVLFALPIFKEAPEALLSKKSSPFTLIGRHVDFTAPIPSGAYPKAFIIFNDGMDVTGNFEKRL